MSKPKEVDIDKVLRVLGFIQEPGVADLIFLLHDTTEALVLRNLIPDDLIESFEKAAKQVQNISLSFIKNPEFTTQYFATIKSILNNSSDKDVQINNMFALLSDEKYSKQLSALSKIRSAIEEDMEQFKITIGTIKNMTNDDKQDLLQNADTQSEGYSSGYDEGTTLRDVLMQRQNSPSPIFMVVREPIQIKCRDDFIAEVKKIFPEFEFNAERNEVITRVPEYSEANKERFEDLKKIVDIFADKLAEHAKIKTASTMTVEEIKESATQYFIPKLLGQEEMMKAGSATRSSNVIAESLKNNSPLLSSSGRVLLATENGEKELY